MKLSINTQILIGLALGVFVGVVIPSLAVELQIIGLVYVNLLKMIVVPLVFASIYVAISGIGTIEQLKDIGLKTFLLYMLTTMLAVVLAIVCMNIFQVGDFIAKEGLELSSTIAQKDVTFSTMILSFIPTNIFSSLTSGSMMPIIVFSALLGIASLHLNKANQVSLFSFFDAISNVMLLIATWVIKLTPIGVFSLISYLVATQGLGSILELWSYVLMVLFVLLVHGGVTLPILLKAFTKINPYKYFNQIKEVPLTAFSTASSAATLPMSLKVSQEKGGVSQKTASFVLPLGATVSMDGTAAYLSIAVLFIANISGIQLSFFDQVLLGITVVSLSIGVAALPSASLVMMIVILNQLGLPVEYIAVIFAVDRILDMARTSLNVTSDMFVAKIIDTISSTKTK